MKWLLLDADIAGREYTLQQISKSLLNRKIDTAIYPLFDKGKLATNDDIAYALNCEKPDVILFQGPYGWKYTKELINSGAKIHNLNFDDPIMRMEGLGVIEDIKHVVYRKEVNIWCWDKYWSDQMYNKYTIICNHINLACHPDEFFTSDVELGNEVMFIGNLHSPKVIEDKIDRLPTVFKKVVQDIKNLITNAEWPLSSWDKFVENGKSCLSEGSLKLFQGLCESKPNLLYQLRHIIWTILKNEARIRMLKKALEVCPITIACESKQQDHANTDEVRGLIGEWSRKLNVVCTSGMKQKEFSHLYHCGSVHLNATDPQSVESGIPFRVFQTAASGKGLITDTRPGLKDAFIPKEEYMPYENLDELQAILSTAINNLPKVREIGTAARARFEKDHTWDNRVDQLEGKVTSEFASLIPMSEINALIESGEKYRIQK